MDQEIALLNQALQEQGYRLTPARKTICHALVQSGGHISADDLAEIVERAMTRAADRSKELGQ